MLSTAQDRRTDVSRRDPESRWLIPKCLDISHRCWIYGHFGLDGHHPGKRNRGAISKIQETAATSPVAPC